MVAVALVQYDNTPPPVLPAVTAAKVILIVAGEHTSAGLVMLNAWAGLIVTTTGLISEQILETLLM